MNMDFKRKLPIPMEVKEQFPITPELKAIKTKRDAEIKAIFEGKEMIDLFLSSDPARQIRMTVL